MKALAMLLAAVIATAQKAEIYRVSPEDSMLLSEKYAAMRRANKEWEDAKKEVTARLSKASGKSQPAECLNYNGDFSLAHNYGCVSTIRGWSGGLGGTFVEPSQRMAR